MNGKKARRFRAAARSITQGKPDVAYITEGRKVKRKDGTTANLPGTVRLHPECTRKVYKEMKQGKREVLFLSDEKIAEFIAQQQAGGTHVTIQN